MPRFDGTGPMGDGPMTGGGFGYCYTPRSSLEVRRVPRFGRRRGYYGYGRGYGRGHGRGYGYSTVERYPIPAKSKRQWLLEQKELLKQELDYISDQLDNIEEE
ncbi:MAG: DUF5320 domain-containing protein [Firmicutes bacterium]|nr:DUF5320 domain-containing protein [Bacillota bacterium]